jgi:hypothetical protein
VIDQRDPICERLGDLAARTAPGDERLPDARAWARIGQEIDRRGSWRSRRRLVPVLALCLALAAVGALVARRPLDYRVQGCDRISDNVACATAGSLAFSDGTQVSLDPGSRVRVLPFARGAELSLDDGAATLAVVHRARARWAVLAGPFRVEVTGTHFSIRWTKPRQVLDVAVQEGEVRVSGGTLARAAVLRKGQTLRAEGHPSSSDGPTDQAALPSPATSGPTDSEGAREHASTTRVRGLPRSSQRKNPAARDVASAATQAARMSGVEHADADQPEPAGLAEVPAQIRSRPSAGDAPSSSAPPAHRSWASASSLGISAPRAASTTGLAANQVALGGDGRLAGAMTGRTWLARGEGTKLSTPDLEEDRAPLLPGKDGLCVSGTVAGLRCVNSPHVRCNWSRNWGVVVGFDVRAEGRAWGDDAAPGIAVQFHGRSSSYRLNAHRKGDPAQVNYCIDNYKSGRLVTPSMFKSRCWDDDGEALPDFTSVDQFSLQFMSGMEYVAFHYCISGIRVDR